MKMTFVDMLRSPMRSLVLFVSMMLCTQLLFGQSAGTTSFEFLKSQYSPRGAAMANNLIAVEGDVGAMFNNPAILSSVTDPQWTLSYVDHLLDFQAGQLAYVRQQGGLGNVGVGLLYFSYGDFDETNQFGEETGNTFGATEFAVAASIANALGDGFDYGVNIKFIYSSLETYNSSGLAVDAGILYNSFFGGKVGVSVSNLGFVLSKYTETEQKMPLYMRVGWSRRLAHLPLLFTVSLNDLTLQTDENIDVLKRFSIGGEFDLSEYVKLRFGYDNNINQNVKPLGGRSLGGISGGLGIAWKKFQLDYAFSVLGDLGSQNRLGVTGTL